MFTFRVWLGAGLLMAVGVLASCDKPLFPENAPRSPYDRYQSLRGQERPMHVRDGSGSNRPALRERLRPLDEP